MTQEQLSEKAGIASEYLSRLERARQVPSIDTIADLAEALNMSPAAILGEPQPDVQAELVSRLVAALGPIADGDMAFLESHFADLVSHLNRLRQKS